MNLFSKCLTFLLVVLFLQLGIFTALGVALQNAEQSADRLAYSTQIDSSRERIVHVFFEATQSATLMAISANLKLGRRLDDLSRELPAIVQDLRASHYANKEDQIELEKMSQITTYLVDEIRYLRDTISQGGTQDSIRQAVKFIKFQLMPHLTDLNAVMESLQSRHQNIENAADASQKFRSLLHSMIASGFLVSIAATVLIVTAFAIGVSNRINQVADNFSRHAQGTPLHPPQKGLDEISLLDRRFHSLSEALSEAAAKDQAVFANMPVALITCLPDGTIEELNPLAQELFGTGGKGAFNIRQLQVAATGDGDILDATTARGVRRTRWQRADGSQFPAELSVSQFNLSGQTRLLLALLDVSDRENIENLRQEFVAIVSHDINSPLTSIRMCLSLFEEGVFGPVSDRGREQLQVAQREGARLIRLTGDLLDMAKIESGNVQLDKEINSVNTLMSRALEAVEGPAKRAAVNVRFEPTQLDVMADSDRIIQILVNFLSNAIKYTPAGKAITVSAEELGANIRISVRDQGQGIPESYLSQIFERFKQVSSEDKRRGTGLGLAICRMLAEAHGGSVGVSSQVGEGSTFWIELPSGKAAQDTIS